MTDPERLLKKLVNERSQLRKSFTLTIKRLENLEKDLTLETFEPDFLILSDKAERLFILDRQVGELLYDIFLEDSKECEEESNKVEFYRERWVHFCSINQKLSKIVNKADVESVSQVDKRNIRLPKLELNKFDGNLKHWIGFWAQYKKIHEDDALDMEDKFQYLIQSTKPDSPARRLVASFPPSAENYPIAVRQLKTRFGRDEMLIELYVRELLQLVLSKGHERSIRDLYDKLETQLRALGTLGVTSEKYACMLMPLVESSLPESILKEWERRRGDLDFSTFKDNDSEVMIADKKDTKELRCASLKLELLLKFLCKEVESEERMRIAQTTFPSSSFMPKESKKSRDRQEQYRTANDLINIKKPTMTQCVFCEGKHTGENCFKARDSMTVEELEKILSKKGCCFLCLKPKHTKRFCNSGIKCIVCADKHSSLLCPDRKKKLDEPQKPNDQVENALLNPTYNQVLMQTLMVLVKGKHQNYEARLLFDSGSQRSYVTKRIATLMSYEPMGQEKLGHMLFGGAETEIRTHTRYKLRIGSTQTDYCCNFDVLDTDNICHSVPCTTTGPWVNELLKKGITLSDCKEKPIDVLVGADIAGKLITGRKEILSCGLAAFETLLGWTIMGRVKNDVDNTMTNISMSNTSFAITDLWKLDVIGIQDPVQVKSQEDHDQDTQNYFEETVKVLDDGRYEVRLPWIEGHAPLSRNFGLAKKRLDSSMKKLKSINAIKDYNDVLIEWLKDGIVEEVPFEDWDHGHYVPHRPVFKEHSTTRIRPVFDASSHEVGQPSLNQCLAKGRNLIELIPNMLLRFRLANIGVIADIKKAFLQISINKDDRDFLRFLWITNNELKILRHKRVVFGVSSSPFLLMAVIEHLLKRIENGDYTFSPDNINKLKRSWYVDNTVASVSSHEELNSFIKEATDILALAQFELRGWEYSDPSLESPTNTAVLGIRWDRKSDFLKISIPIFGNEYTNNVTKRNVLSAYQKIFDPIGILVATLLIPKILIQKIWTKGGGWDDEIDQDLKDEFVQWINEVSCLREVGIERCVKRFESKLTLHTFCDASQKAYAAVCFLREENEDGVTISLIGAKARVTPLSKITIPRLELLAATIGARLAYKLIEEFNNVDSYFWSDSSTVLAWIKRQNSWGIFVSNRVTEIKKLTNLSSWNHISGQFNPADLLSRGCSPSQLLRSKWWEGPSWMRLPLDEWPVSVALCNEDEINEERKKTIVVANNVILNDSISVLMSRYSNFECLIRVFAWIFHWKNKQRTPGLLSPSELDQSEILVWRCVQRKSFQGIKDKQLRKLKPVLDENGLIRLRTKIMFRKDEEYFRMPIILPPNHDLVEKLILFKHTKCGHVSGQCLLSILREKYWILRGRQVIRRVLKNCTICQRYHAKHLDAEVSPLPVERVRDAQIFEICGTDFTGPLYTSDSGKVWVVIFTCAVFRAVHFDVVSSLSTESFLMAFQRFIARRGRPQIMYSDNGTNFRGLSNTLGTVDWKEVAIAGSVDRIEWRFSPPSAPWWGGFWERMVRLLKNLLRKILGSSCLTQEELYTVLTDCEAIINSRPITYMSEDGSDPIPISPNMFLQELKEIGVPDLDSVESSSLEKRLRYRLKLKTVLRERFRREYLGQLVISSQKSISTRQPTIGEVVLIGSEEKKRLDWPLAIVEQVIPGRDGRCRVVYLKTAKGQMCRPIQRVYPLEINCNCDISGSSHDDEDSPQDISNGSDIESEENNEFVNREVSTRCGRLVKIPVKYR